MSEPIYHFYMKQMRPNNSGTERDLESYFKKSFVISENPTKRAVYGLHYIKAEGINDLGAIKTVYEEDYAEAQGVQVWTAPNATRKETKVKFTFFFDGAPQFREKIYHNFIDFISESPILYYDDARKRYVYLVLEKAVEVKTDEVKDEYMIAEVEFTNIFGRSYDEPVATTRNENAPWVAFDSTATRFSFNE